MNRSRSLPRSALIAFCAVIALGACKSNILKSSDPVCGPRIKSYSVKVVDLTPYEPSEALIAAAVREQVGNFQFMTDEPVWIPKRTSAGDYNNTGKIAGVQSIAAEWGCDLLVLLDVKMTKNDLRRQSRNENRTWLVHAGRRQSP
jgi:hypothetical protein